MTFAMDQRAISADELPLRSIGNIRMQQTMYGGSSLAVDQYPVPSFALGCVQRFVRAQQSLLEGVGRVAQIGATDAHGDLQGNVRQSDHHGTHSLQQAVRQPLQAIATRFRHQHAELFPAQACQQVRIAQLPADGTGQLPQDFVAHGMPVGIVDAFEMIHIEDEHPQGTLMA